MAGAKNQDATPNSKREDADCGGHPGTRISTNADKVGLAFWEIKKASAAAELEETTKKSSGESEGGKA